MPELNDKMLERYTQEAAAYTPISLNAGEACANCRWFIGSASGGPACHIIENYPLDIEPTGYCNKHEGVEAAIAENELPTIAQMSASETEKVEARYGIDNNAWRVVGETKVGDQTVSVQLESLDASKEKIGVVYTLTSEDIKHDTPLEMDSVYIAPHDGVLKSALDKLTRKGGLKAGASVIKANGTRYMLVVTSNSYKDREDETITTQALTEYVNKSWIAEDLFHSNNPLLYWHDDRLEIGQIVWADMHGPFLVELAQEGNTPVSKALFDYRESHPNEKWGASHRFAYFKKDRADDGTYRRIYKQETSILPREAAANSLTFSGVIPMVNKRGETLNKMLGLDNAAELLDKGIGELVAELSKRNIEHKSAEKPDTEVVAETEKVFGKLVMGLIDSQAEVMERMDALESGVTEKSKSQDDANKSTADQLKALTEAVQSLSIQLDQRPRSATRANETVLETAESKELAKTIQDMTTHIDPMWGRVKE